MWSNLRATRAQFVQRGAEARGGLVTESVVPGMLRMAIVTKRARPIADQRIRGTRDGVLSVALPAFRPLVLLERDLVTARVEELAVQRMTAAACLRNARNRRRHRRMASVAPRAGRRAQIALFQ